MARSSLFRAALCGAALAFLFGAADLRAQGGNPACWESDLGADLQLGDDSISAPLSLGFDFPLPGGGTSAAIDVCSNGWIGLIAGAQVQPELTPDPASFVANPPRLAVHWTDLNPSLGGSVRFNTFAATGSLPARAVVTWDAVPRFGRSVPNSVQAQLFADGAVQVTVREQDEAGINALLVGISAGNGVTDPGSSDLSSATANSGTLAVLYEFFTASDLTGLAVRFVPNNGGGYTAFPVPGCPFAQAVRFGAGCPMPAAFYEQFQTTDLGGRALRFTYDGAGWAVTDEPNGFDPDVGDNLLLGDDQLAVGLALGFDFPLPGLGTTTDTIDVDTNGWIGLVSGGFVGSDFTESVPEFLGQAPRIAAFWDDFNPTAGGGVFYGTTPGQSARITWQDVPQFGNVDQNTFQVQLFANGDMVWSWPQVAADGLVGYSAGGITSDVPGIDLTASVPFLFAGFGRASVVLAGRSLPVLGATTELELFDLPTAGIVAVNLGLARTDIDLAAVGAPNCFLRTIPIATLLATPAGAGATVQFPLPLDPYLAGASLYAQGLAVEPGLNALGAFTSNGLELRIGL